MNSKFIEASTKFNGVFNKTDFKVEGMIGSRLPITIYHLDLNHKNTSIKIAYEFGNTNIAEIKFNIQVSQKVPDLKIVTRDHFTRLFTLNKTPWKTKCENKFFTSKIVHILRTSGITEIANKEAFEPLIQGYYKGNTYKFDIKFYLGFNKKENSLIPIIEFSKNIIDYITENYCK